MKNQYLTTLAFLTLSIISLLVISACSPQQKAAIGSEGQDEPESQTVSALQTVSSAPTEPMLGEADRPDTSTKPTIPVSEFSVDNWRFVNLADAVSGDDFSVNQFVGKTVLLESFAVWCPTCLKQQKEMAKLSNLDSDIVHISLDTDPNEDVAVVATHVRQNGFDWNFAVSPSEYTQKLIDEFGLNIVSAPQAPVVMICPDQSARLLGRGVKSVDELIEEVEMGC